MPGESHRFTSMADRLGRLNTAQQKSESEMDSSSPGDLESPYVATPSQIEHHERAVAAHIQRDFPTQKERNQTTSTKRREKIVKDEESIIIQMQETDSAIAAAKAQIQPNTQQTGSGEYQKSKGSLEPEAHTRAQEHAKKVVEEIIAEHKNASLDEDLAEIGIGQKQTLDDSTIIDDLDTKTKVSIAEISLPSHKSDTRSQIRKMYRQDPIGKITKQKLQTERLIQEDEKLSLKNQREAEEREARLVRQRTEDQAKLNEDVGLSVEIQERLIQNIDELIKKIGRNTLIDQYKLPGIISKKWKTFSQNELKDLYRRLLEINKIEHSDRTEQNYFYHQAEKERSEREAYVRENFDTPLEESDRLSAEAEAEAEKEGIFFEQQAQRQEEEREVARAKLAREREEVNAYVRDHFDKPLEESERLLNEQKKAEEPGTEPTIRVEPTDPSSIYKLGPNELKTHPGRFDLLNESEQNKKILQQWREQIPQMSLETLNANAKHAFDIDLNDQTREGLTKVEKLVNLPTVRGEIFRMLYNKFVEITTRQKGIKIEERPIQTEQRAQDEATRIELIKKEINQGETQMLLLIEQVSPYLTAPQKFEMHQIYRERLQAQTHAEWKKLLEVTERAINTLTRFQSTYEELQKRGALKTSTPPTIKPPGLFSRIKSFFGGSKK